MKPIFVFSTPHSGSTLLMRILASCPDIAFTGESFGFLEQLIRTHIHTQHADHPAYKTHPAEVAKMGFKVAGYNNTNMDAWTPAVRKVMEAWTGADPTIHKAWGWKEAATFRFPDGPKKLKYLHTMVPDAHFVFLIRNFEDTVKSMMKVMHHFSWWFARDEEQLRAVLTQQRQNFQVYRMMRPEATSLMTFDDVVNGDLSAIPANVPREIIERELGVNPRGALGDWPEDLGGPPLRHGHLAPPAMVDCYSVRDTLVEQGLDIEATAKAVKEAALKAHSAQTKAAEDKACDPASPNV